MTWFVVWNGIILLSRRYIICKLDQSGYPEIAEVPPTKLHGDGGTAGLVVKPGLRMKVKRQEGVKIVTSYLRDRSRNKW